MPGARRTVAHLSDPHLRGPADPLLRGLDPVVRLRRALDILVSWDVRCDAWVLSGDLSDDGSPESYRLLRSLVSDAAGAVGVRVVWANGNHDDRRTFRRELLDADGAGPVDTAHDLDGLRVLTLDTTVPGVPWGRVAESSLSWLAEQLAAPAPLGTLLVMHHAPIPQPQPDANERWPLRDPDAVGRVLAGSDVRAILSGHFHQPSAGSLAGVPVFATTALSYTQDLSGGRGLHPQDAHQGFQLVEVHDRTVVATPVFLDRGAALSRAGHADD